MSISNKVDTNLSMGGLPADKVTEMEDLDIQVSNDHRALEHV